MCARNFALVNTYQDDDIVRTKEMRTKVKLNLNCRTLKIKRILVSQPKPSTPKSPYFDLADKSNVKIDFRPFIHIEGVAAKEFRNERIYILDHSAVIFTSRTAIDHFFRICQELRITVPDSMKYFCVSEATAFYLQKYIVYRKRKIFYGDGKFSVGV